MITMINANPNAVVTTPNLTGLGLMNNILPFLIPLVLLWVAYKETKRTSAMFAGDVIQFTEKIGKTAVTAATMLATAGAGMAISAAKGAGGKIKGGVGTMADEKKWKDWKEEHPTVGGKLDKAAGAMQWGKRRKEDVETKIVAPIKTGVKEDITDPLKKRVKEFQDKHPEFTGYASAAKKGLKTAITGREEKEGRELTPEEVDKKQVGKMVTVNKPRKITQEEVDKSEKGEKITLKSGIERKLTKDEIEKGTVIDEEKEWQKERDLTAKELDLGKKTGKYHEIETETKPGIVPEFKKVMKVIEKGLDDAIQDELEERLTTISAKLSKDLKQIKELQRKIDNDEDINFEDDIKDLKKVEIDYRRFHGEENVTVRDLNEEVKNTIKKSKKELEEEAEEEQIGLQRFKISDHIHIPKIHRKKREERDEEEKEKEEKKETREKT